MKFKTVRDGQRAVVFNYRGEGRVIEGPHRIFLYRERFSLLESVTAGRFEYVEIHANDGSIIHKPGPCQVFNNPLVYSQVTKKQAQCVDANHLLVVYKRIKGGGSQRRIVQGPALFIPEAEEWIHEFVWHGTDPDNKTRLIPGSNKFTLLPTIPQNFYYNVRDVRTTDDTMLTVKVMLFYSMVDVLQMLDSTHDPVADLVNALCADVIAFVSALSYSEFVGKVDLFSSLGTYPQLQERAKRIGFKVQKVVYRGYHASEQHQNMQNAAIESRTQLRLEREIQDQQQTLTSFVLSKKNDRSSLEQKKEEKQQEHNQKLEELKHQHKLKMEQMKAEHEIDLAQKDTEVRLEYREAENQHRMKHLANLAQAHVDLTTYLTLQNPPAPTEEIRVTQSSSKSPASSSLSVAIL